MIRELFLVSLGVCVGAILFVAYPAEAEQRTFDEKKWERIERNREIRRATEARYEACARRCLEGCR